MKLHSNPFLRSAIAPATWLLALALTHSAHAASATWTGLAGNNVLNTGTNWTAGGPPILSGDVATWDGTATGDLALTWTSAFGAGSPGIGTSINITGTQTGSLLIGGTSGAFALASITIDDTAGAFTLGDGTALDAIVFRGTHPYRSSAEEAAPSPSPPVSPPSGPTQ